MTQLPTKQLGRTGLNVTALGFGAMELRGAPRGRPVDAETAKTVLNGVLNAGINYIDTSIDYGQSEEFIGSLIAGRRDEYFLATKCGCVVGAAPAPAGQRNPHIFTRENIIAGVEQSLRRMNTDYIDVLQFHASPSKRLLEENGAIETVQELQRQGKVRFIGMSGTIPNLADHIAMGVFDVFQIPYSGLDRSHEELITAAGKAGAGIVIRGGVAKGAPAADKQAGDAWDAWQSAGLDDLLDGMTPVEFLLRYTLSHPELDTTIVGTLNPEHLRDNLAAATKGPLPPDVYAEATRRLDAAGITPQRE
jgi:aryl-alcohol dehydrogenase-like predicted oxidoreductase